MPMVTDQAQMDAYVKSNMLEMVTDMSDAVYGLLHPRLVACDFCGRSVVAVFRTTPAMRNSNNVLHGGVTATMLDSIGGVVTRCFTPAAAIAPTVSLQVSYLEAIPLDVDVHVRASVTHAGRKLLHVRSEAFDPEEPERVYATGTAVYFIHQTKGASHGK